KKVRVTSPMASRRLGVVGQSKRYAPGERRLRHERASLPVPPYAQGRGTSLIADDKAMLGQCEPRACRNAYGWACPLGADRAANHKDHRVNGGREGRLRWEADTGGCLTRLR